MLNESKSETASEAASQGVKRNFSPTPSHSSKDLEDEMEVKRRKKIGELVHFLFIWCRNYPFVDIIMYCNVYLKTYAVVEEMFRLHMDKTAWLSNGELTVLDGDQDTRAELA